MAERGERPAPDSFISLLLHDTQRQPIDASPRRRHPAQNSPTILDNRQRLCGLHNRARSGNRPTVLESIRRP